MAGPGGRRASARRHRLSRNTTLTAPPASADGPPRKITDTVISDTTIEKASDSSANGARREAATKEYVREQARQGRLVDTGNTRSAVVKDLSVVWDAPVVIDAIKVDTVQDDAAVDDSAPKASPEAEGLGIAARVDGTAVDDTDEVSSGVGLGGVSDAGGGSRLSGNCVTTKSSTGNTLTSCYEKYRLKYKTSSYDYFYYGSWATATGKQISLGTDYTPTKIDIRTRPWSTQSGQVKQLNNYWPKSGQKLCTASGEVGFEWEGFKASIPIQDCKEVTPDPNATTRTMGVVYDQGTIFGGRSHGTEFGMVYGTTKGTNPSMADYNYSKYCRGTYANCDGVLRKDSGW